MSALSLLEELDQIRRELQNEYPGWQIWYVFHHDGPATWHARPKPWLNAPSPDDLRKLISQANPHTDADAAAIVFSDPQVRCQN
jgi:hypothetical protein